METAIADILATGDHDFAAAAMYLRDADRLIEVWATGAPFRHGDLRDAEGWAIAAYVEATAGIPDTLSGGIDDYLDADTYADYARQWRSALEHLAAQLHADGPPSATAKSVITALVTHAVRTIHKAIPGADERTALLALIGGVR